MPVTRAPVSEAIFSLASLTFVSVRPLTTTSDPSRARPRAMAKPIPDVEPVTSALGRWPIESTGRRAAEALSVILDFWFAPPIERSATRIRDTHPSCLTWPEAALPVR
jgi:hypothetical protein